MKTINRFQWIAISLSILMLLQSCKVYHGNTVSMEEAVASTKRILVKDYSTGTYKFDGLLLEKGQLYGFTKKGSATTKLLNEQVVEINSKLKYVKIHLPENTIKSYHLQNRTMSTLLTVLIPVALIASLAFIPTQKTKTVDLDLRL